MTKQSFRGMAVVVIAIAGVAALIIQWRTIGRLREEVAVARKQMAEVVAQKPGVKKGGVVEVRNETTERRAPVDAAVAATSSAIMTADAQALSVQPVTAATERETSSSSNSADDVKKAQEIARLRARYDSFFRERGMSDAEAEQFIGLIRERAEIRQELQAAVRDAGATGGTRGVEALRTELYQPITDQMRALLGEDGYQAYNEFEGTSFYRSAYVERMAPVFAAANAGLSPEQNEQLVRIVAANDHPVRKSATDIGTESRIDWAAVAQQAGLFLTAQQKQALATFVDRDARR